MYSETDNIREKDVNFRLNHEKIPKIYILILLYFKTWAEFMTL